MVTVTPAAVHSGPAQGNTIQRMAVQCGAYTDTQTLTQHGQR